MKDPVKAGLLKREPYDIKHYREKIEALKAVENPSQLQKEDLAFFEKTYAKEWIHQALRKLSGSLGVLTGLLIVAVSLQIKQQWEPWKVVTIAAGIPLALLYGYKWFRVLRFLIPLQLLIPGGKK